MSRYDDRTRVGVHVNQYKTVTSTLTNAKMNLMAFNMDLIAQTHPRLAKKLAKIYDKLPTYKESK